MVCFSIVRGSEVRRLPVTRDCAAVVWRFCSIADCSTFRCFNNQYVEAIGDEDVLVIMVMQLYLIVSYDVPHSRKNALL